MDSLLRYTYERGESPEGLACLVEKKYIDICISDLRKHLQIQLHRSPDKHRTSFS